ncbi:hypothetical protein [Pseudomonas sp. S1_F04]
MDANGLLSVLAILVAAFTLLSEAKRLDISLRMSMFDWAILLMLTAIVLVIIYSPLILELKVVGPIPWRWGFTPPIAIFTSLMLMLLFVSVKMGGRKIPRANYTKWLSASELLLREKKLGELGYLLHRHHAQLFSEVGRKPWYSRVHDYLYPVNRILLVQMGGKEPSYHFYRVRVFLASFFPKEGSKQKVVSQSISNLLKSKIFISYLAETYPLVAAKATMLRFSHSEEVVNTFIVALMSNPHSSLYRELRDNQNCSHTGEYYIDGGNSLLSFYLKDVSVAADVLLWRPIGNYVLNFIKEHKGRDDYYNQPNNNFSEGEARWGCPIFIGSFLFEIMVSVAIFQRVNHHMWLMYAESFLEAMIENLDYHESVDVEREFPSRYDYLIYNIFSACDSWVGAVEYLDLEQSPGSQEDYPEWWAAKTYGSMLRKIIVSKKLSDSQKIYYLEIAVGRMKRLDGTGLEKYSKLVVDNCLRKYEWGEMDWDCVKKLRSVYRSIDHVLRSRKSTFEIELSKIGEE